MDLPLAADQLGGFDLSLTGFGDLELKDIMADRTAGLTDPDDAPATPEHPVSQTGDLWILGRRRLLCGDSTVARDVERVLGGVAPHLMVTDPPYGVNYDPAWRNRAARTSVGMGNRLGAGAVGKVMNDDVADWREAWALFTVIWSTQSARQHRLGSISACGLADSNLAETADRFLHSSLGLIA